MGRSEIKEIKLALFEILDVSSLTPKLKCNCKKKKKEKTRKKMTVVVCLLVRLSMYVLTTTR